MDEAFRPLGSILESMLAFDAQCGDEAAGVRLYVEACEIESPVELDVQWNAEGKLQIGSTPPLYPLMTTVAPVFHRLRFLTRRVEDDDGRE